MLQIHVARNCGPTARVLAKLLTDADVKLGSPGTAHLCWGFAPAALTGPALNANVNRTKLDELLTLAKHVNTVPPIVGALPVKSQYPVLARRTTHRGGTDIMLCKNERRAKSALMRGRAYFTTFVPSSTEFRVWIYRRRHLGTYEKVLTYPERLRNRRGKLRIGRNYNNGWTFQLVEAERVPREGVTLAASAVEALNLDFGAVDILAGKDGKFYVLEVNSAPGVEGENRQVIQSLATHIAHWFKHGCVKRREKDK